MGNTWFDRDPAMREVFRDVAAAIEAIVVALQVSQAGSDPTAAIDEAARRAVAIRRHVRDVSDG